METVWERVDCQLEAGGAVAGINKLNGRCRRKVFEAAIQVPVVENGILIEIAVLDEVHFSGGTLLT